MGISKDDAGKKLAGFDLNEIDAFGAKARKSEKKKPAIRKRPKKTAKCGGPGCDNVLEKPARGPMPKFCSTTCRVRAYRARDEDNA